jgi:hypothetical protein
MTTNMTNNVNNSIININNLNHHHNNNYNNSPAMIAYNIKLNKFAMESYMQEITEKVMETTALKDAMEPSEINEIILNDNGEISIPTMLNYNILLQKNVFRVADLKRIAKHYSLKLVGTKKDLTFRVYFHLHFSSFIIKIQRVFRGKLQRLFCTKMHGPAYLNRSLCVNQTDFLSMDLLTQIPLHQFFSYKDVDGFIYGFDAVSLHNLIAKNVGKLCNPYNRNNFPTDTLNNFKKLIKVSKLLNMEINTVIQDVANITSQKTLELRVLDLFQNINSLGNYSEPQWFTSLTKNKLVKLVRDLFDIWNYRLQISFQTKCAICPPNGNLFRSVSVQELTDEPNVEIIKGKILKILETLVNSGIDRDSKCLGAYYVLGALTLVNEAAAVSLPWLYQSVSYY